MNSILQVQYVFFVSAIKFFSEFYFNREIVSIANFRVLFTEYKMTVSCQSRKGQTGQLAGSTGTGRPAGRVSRGRQEGQE